MCPPSVLPATSLTYVSCIAGTASASVSGQDSVDNKF